MQSVNNYKALLESKQAKVSNFRQLVSIIMKYINCVMKYFRSFLIHQEPSIHENISGTLETPWLYVITEAKLTSRSLVFHVEKLAFHEKNWIVLNFIHLFNLFN